MNEMNLLIFAFERSIVHSTLGIVAVLLLKLLASKYLLIKIPNIWLRCFLYAVFGALFIMYDYSSNYSAEFAQINFLYLLVIALSSIIWMYLLVIPFIYIAETKRKNI
jgi:hypothetical protein